MDIKSLEKLKANIQDFRSTVVLLFGRFGRSIGNRDSQRRRLQAAVSREWWTLRSILRIWITLQRIQATCSTM